ncbi:hypothetical protein Gohar_004911 [Gossypium harknessii]|uniref:RNase H type-1 domain-containing protein n=1 Tax=Gossypium harknessii TaxID=34285 RepID=A0A7J9H6B7_9ROSI|nr:hypothetical protein [Gossypium harknessii]
MTGRELSQRIQRYMAELDGLGERKIIFNFDATFDKRNSKSASGLVVRGLMGAILASKIVLHNNVSSPFAAKAYAGLQAITLGISMGILSVAIMGDSRTVIKKCQTTKPDKSVIGAIIRDIQSKKSHFQEINFQFIHRSENVYAHKLAQEALEKGEDLHLMRVVSDHNRSAPEGRWLRNPD